MSETEHIIRETVAWVCGAIHVDCPSREPDGPTCPLVAQAVEVLAGRFASRGAALQGGPSEEEVERASACASVAAVGFPECYANWTFEHWDKIARAAIRGER